MSGAKIRVQVWDTAGQERYKSICSAHFRDANGALIVYDLTRENTFYSCQKWLEDFRQSAEPDAKIMLVGNKLDVIENNPELRKVSKDEAQRFADLNNQLYKETSAITDAFVGETFITLLQGNNYYYYI